MSRENLLNSVEGERADAETLAQQERDTVEPITQTPYVVLSEEMNPISFHNGLSGSLTKLSNGDDYLVAGTSDISLSTGSNGSITVDMDDVVYDNWKVGPGAAASGSAGLETILRDETSRGGLEIYRASDAAKSKFMSIKNLGTNSTAPLTVISDEEGGLFVSLTNTTGQAQNAKTGNLIHIDTSGSVSNFDVMVNGSIYSLLLSGSGVNKTLFAGGNFTTVGHSAPAAIAVDLSTGEASNPFEVSSYHNISDMIELSDGSIIIGGGFTRVKGITRNGLAKINPDGTLSTWNPGVMSIASGYPHYVYSLVADEANDVLYVGGNFSRAGDGHGSTTRSNLAAVKISDGTVTPWNPGSTSSGLQYPAAIRKMILDSGANRLYVGGFFSALGNGGSATAVSNMGAISTLDGSRINWSPYVSGAVYDMVFDSTNSLIYAGGTFTTANAITRNRLAAWSTTGTGLLTPTAWDPGASNDVRSLAHDSANNKMYVGGTFTTLGGGVTGVASRKSIGVVSTSDSGTADPAWDPNAIGAVYGITLSDNNVYIGGTFGTIGTQAPGETPPPQVGLAKLAKADGVDTGAKLTWDYQYAAVGKVFIYSNKLYAFSPFGQGAPGSLPLYLGNRRGLFAIDANYRGNSGAIANKDTFLKPWNPGASGTVLSLEKDTINPVIYVGGGIARMGVNADVPRQNLASVDSRDAGAISDWAPYINSTCSGLKIDSSEQKVYVAGYMTRAGDSLTARNYLARFSTSSTSPSTISVQGGVDISGLATISTPWPSSTGRISYGAGENGTSGTSYRVINISAAPSSTVSITFDLNLLSVDYLTIVNLDTSTVVTADTSFGTSIHRVKFSSLPQGNYGIGIKSTSGASASYGWRLESVTYDLPADSWNPNVSDLTYSIDLDSTDAYVCGRFETIGGLTRKRVAAISKSTGVATSWNPGLNMAANVIKKSGDSVYVGGDFTGLASSTTTGLLYNTVASPTNADGYVADLNVNGDVFASVALADGSFIIGGSFTSAGGQPRNGLAKFSAAGVLDGTWNPNVYAVSGMAVRAIEYNSSTGLIYVGGTFSRVGGGVGPLRSNLAAIYTTGGGPVDGTWNPGCSGDVHALNLDTANSRIFVGGSFTASNVSSGNSNSYGSVISTDLQAAPTTSTASSCAAGLTVQIPMGATVTSVNTSYSMAAVSQSTSASASGPSVAGSTTLLASPTTSSISACPTTVTVTVPVGAVITGTSVAYSITAASTGQKVQQRSFVKCSSTGGTTESSVYSGTGATTGTQTYSRTGLNIANGVSSSGSVDFQLHAFRTLNGSGCNTTWNYVNAGTFVVTVNYTLSGQMGQQRSYVACTNVGGITESSVSSGVGASTGTYNYSRTGLSIANSVSGGGNITFELRAFRTSHGSSCNSTYNYVNAGWSVTVNYTVPVSLGGGLSGALNSGAASRSRLGAVSTSGVGTAINWDPQVTSGTVQALARNATSNLLYVGGTWNIAGSFAGITRSYLGAVSTTATGTVTGEAGFSSSPNGNVTGLVYDPTYSTLYCAGRFTSIGGITRYMMAVLNATNGTAWSWNGGSSSYASSSIDRKVLLDTARNRVYFSNSIYGHGLTTASDGSPVSSISCFSRPTASNAPASIVDWNPGIYGTINTISVNSSGVLFAGLTSGAFNWKTIYPTDRVVKLSALTSTAPDVLEWGTVTSRQRDSVRGLYVGNAFGGEYVIATCDDAKSSAAATAMTYGASTTTLKPRYVVENDMLKMSYQLNVTSTQTLAGNGNYIITLPQGWYIDTEKVTLGTVEGYYSDFSNATIVGIGSIRGSFVGGGGAWALIPINRTQMVLVGKSPASNQVVVWGANVFSWTLPGGLKVHLTTCIPVKRNNLY